VSNLGTSLALIQPSAWKGDSRKFASKIVHRTSSEGLEDGLPGHPHGVGWAYRLRCRLMMHRSEWEAADEKLAVAGPAQLLLLNRLCDIQRAETFTGQVR
jgi:hypothetical protein